MMPLPISVVIPTYKRPQLLKKCLSGLLQQTFSKHDYEVIVVSDGPDETSQKVIEEYIQEGFWQLRFFSLPHKKGPAAARNMGCKNARGTLIAFTDDDCLPDAAWLENIWKHYNDQSEIAFTGRMVVPVSSPPTDFEMNTKGLETGGLVTANCVCTRGALQKVGGFDEAFKAAWREDSDLHFTLLVHNIPVVKLEDAVVVHPVRNVPWGISLKEQKKSRFNALLYKKYPELYRRRIKPAPSWNYYLILVFFVLCTVALFAGVTWLAVMSFIGWLYLTIAFITKRLSGTSRNASHVAEMVVTSILIPFLSVFWTLYGSIKYRVLFF